MASHNFQQYCNSTWDRRGHRISEINTFENCNAFKNDTGNSLSRTNKTEKNLKPKNYDPDSHLNGAMNNKTSTHFPNNTPAIIGGVSVLIGMIALFVFLGYRYKKLNFDTRIPKVKFNNISLNEDDDDNIIFSMEI